MLVPLIQLLMLIVDIYEWIVIFGVIMSWLVAFDVMNPRNKYVYKLGTFINRATEPALSRIRRVIPPIGGIDISPIVLILALEFVKYALWGIIA